MNSFNQTSWMPPVQFKHLMSIKQNPTRLYRRYVQIKHRWLEENGGRKETIRIRCTKYWVNDNVLVANNGNRKLAVSFLNDARQEQRDVMTTWAITSRKEVEHVTTDEEAITKVAISIIKIILDTDHGVVCFKVMNGDITHAATGLPTSTVGSRLDKLKENLRKGLSNYDMSRGDYLEALDRVRQFMADVF